MAAQRDGAVVKSEEEKHPTHSFKWSSSEHRNGIEIHCSKAGTALDALKRSGLFLKMLGKHKEEEVVIESGGRALCSHIPCTFIKHHLFIDFIKAEDEKTPEPSAPVVRRRRRGGPGQECVTFNVEVKGKAGIFWIMRNPQLKKKVNEVTVYGYKGEKIKHALKQDGRFLDSVFKKNCGLTDISTKIVTEMSNIVDNLEGKTFKITKLDNRSPPISLPSSLEEDPSSVPAEPTEDQGPENTSQQRSAIKTENGAVETDIIPIAEGSTLLEEPVPVLREQLTAQFRDVVRSRKTEARKCTRIQNLFKVEYSKNAELCREVKTMKNLMVLSDSVCQVRVRGHPIGSGFLLFERFVLTNAHVMKEVYETQLITRVTVHFSFLSLERADQGLNVEEVVGGEYCGDGEGSDWALLKLEAGPEVPRCLLSSFGFVPQSGGICIIGHPDGHVKKIDPCVVLQPENRQRVVEKQRQKTLPNIQLITPQFFDEESNDLQQKSQVMTYKTCFYYGSSGSPVFDQNCNVVAMHTGGYPYDTPQKKVESFVEFGYSLSTILEKIILQMVEIRRFDVLEKYLDSRCDHHEVILRNVRKLVDSRNLTEFRQVIDQEVLRQPPHVQVISKMLHFFNQTEEPVPMQTDYTTHH